MSIPAIHTDTEVQLLGDGWSLAWELVGTAELVCRDCAYKSPDFTSE